MHKYLIILLAATVGLSAPAVAQNQPSRFEVFMEVCKYRAMVTSKSIASGELKQSGVESDLNAMPEDRWQRLVDGCKKYESGFNAPPRAPANTVVAKPEGPPRLIVPRPANAPVGEYYRCNADTKLPDPQGTKICGPVTR